MRKKQFDSLGAILVLCRQYNGLALELQALSAEFPEKVARPFLKLLNHAQRETDRIAVEAEKIRDEIVDALPADSLPSRPKASSADPILIELARNGVKKVTITALADGYYSVQLDDAKPFELPLKLAIFLRVIAQDDGSPMKEDRFVAWKSRSAIALGMSEILGAKPSARAVINFTHRLREWFTEKFQNPNLIQSGQRGVRFALVRTPMAGEA